MLELLETLCEDYKSFRARQASTKVSVQAKQKKDQADAEVLRQALLGLVVSTRNSAGKSGDAVDLTTSDSDRLPVRSTGTRSTAFTTPDERRTTCCPAFIANHF